MKLLGDIATNHFLDPETPIPIKTIAFSSRPWSSVTCVRSHTDQNYCLYFPAPGALCSTHRNVAVRWGLGG